MAGLLTDSPFDTFPILASDQWFIDFEWLVGASQQRDCPGFTPDSLLIHKTRRVSWNQSAAKLIFFSRTFMLLPFYSPQRNEYLFSKPINTYKTNRYTRKKREHIGQHLYTLFFQFPMLRGFTNPYNQDLLSMGTINRSIIIPIMTI